MERTESQSWQNLFSWDGTSKMYKGMVEWSQGKTTELWIYTNGAQNNTAIKRARIIYNSLKDREVELKNLAARDLLDLYNEYFLEEPINKQDFIDNLTISFVRILRNKESKIEFITRDGPLVVITLLPDLSYKEALFD